MAIYSLHVSNVSRAAGSSAVASCSYITRVGCATSAPARRSTGSAAGSASSMYARCCPRARPASTSTRSVCSTPSRWPRNVPTRGPRRRSWSPCPASSTPANASAHWRTSSHGTSRPTATPARTPSTPTRTDVTPRAHPRRQPAHRPEDWQMGGEEPQRVRVGRQRPAHPRHRPRHRTAEDRRQKPQGLEARQREQQPLDSKEFLERLRREWADSCNALLPGYAVIDHRSFKARGIERIPTIHEGYASREMEKRGGRGDLCEENRRIQALNRLDARLGP